VPTKRKFFGAAHHEFMFFTCPGFVKDMKPGEPASAVAKLPENENSLKSLQAANTQWFLENTLVLLDKWPSLKWRTCFQQTSV